ncbi:MAG: bifunctional phosphoribosylaminoimidazolecarboxamide formyltransferase/IMP cyclohydrolase [bacterium]|nr:bifunctional phosphoribosylaminoimidazolecarboxamide formyltransferase/IMP cyclohydrolase [bacterium]
MESVNLIKRALISVSDKTGLEEIVLCLKKLNVEILSTGGTATFIRNVGCSVIDISDWTGTPELFNGRVKTLHPKIHGALLYKRDDLNHVQQAKESKVLPIDLVVVNLYPFEQTLYLNESESDLIEQIDIGGPSMLRSAAKNFHSVTVVCDIEDYAELIKQIEQNGGTTLNFRRYLAGKVFDRTANYDALIARVLSDPIQEQHWKKWFTIPLSNPIPLRYGENPKQKATLYHVNGELQYGFANAKVIGGKEISFNNWMDVDSAVRLVSLFQESTCVIVKHASPCGVATANSLVEAYKMAYQCDPTSAFGGVVAFNKPLDNKTAETITSIFTEVVFSPPPIDEEVQKILSKSKNLRWVVCEIPNMPPLFPYEFRRILGGMLVEEIDDGITPVSEWEVVTEIKPTNLQLRMLEFAWKVVKGVKSNAITIVNENNDCFFTIGIGGGETSRIDAMYNALRRAKNFNHPLHSSVLASDAFFPFSDSIELAKQNGIEAIIQPGGSIRDKEVIAAANQAGITMLFTHRRHFRHL